MLALSLIIAGILFRFIPHAPNFTPVAAIALFAGAYMNKKYALIVPLLLMALSDVTLGMHNVILFTWGSFILTSILGLWLKNHKKLLAVCGMSLISSFIFYIVTNFGVWIMGWYPRNTEGLIQCYIMALPFLRNFTVATILYSAFLFAAYGLIARCVKDTKFSKALLTN